MSLEVGRRLVHASGVAIPALYILDVVSWAQVQGLLLLAVGIVVGLETLRLRVGLEWRIYEHLTREYEAHTFAGYGYYVVSVAAVALAFEPAIAVPAMLMLMLGDPLSGLSSGTDPGPIKGWPAIAAMYVLSLVVALPFMLAVQPSSGWAVAAALCGAFPATVADGVRVTVRNRIVDDNLLIPLAGAAGLWVGVTVLPPSW